MSYFVTSGLFEGLFGLFFIVFMAVFLLIAFKSLLQWNKNNHSPRLTVEAKIVSKRMSVHHHNNGVHGHHSSTTNYYVTFQVESGDRMELNLRGSEYGMLAEGDYGSLTFQGTRYLSFQRKL